MIALSSGFAQHVFFNECIAAAQPLSQMGVMIERMMPSFLPGDEERLQKFWDNTQSMRVWIQQHAPQSLEAHLRNLHAPFLEDSPSSWGPVELARLHSVASSLKWVLENTAICLKETERAHPNDVAAVDHILNMLAPHCSDTGFFLKAMPGSPLDAAFSRMQKANARWMDLESQQREETANVLGIAPVRLKSDITLSFDDPKLDLVRSIPTMQEVETAAHYVRFRFIVTGEAQKARDTLLQARREYMEQELTEMVALQNRLNPYLNSFKNALYVAGWVDIHFGRARWANLHDACRPKISTNHVITADDAAHPHIEKYVAQLGHQYQRISFRLQPPITSLTGANMGGKTTFLRTVGLFQLLFQKGYFLPAHHFESFLFRSMAWIGASSDSPHLGLSSFGRECRDLADALTLPEPRLWLVDEFARSTAVEEGMALTGSLMDTLSASETPNHYIFAGHIQNPPSRHSVLFHLHTGELDFEAYHRHVTTMGPEKALAASMNYRVHPGKSNRSDALRIAGALGVPMDIINNAAQILQELHSTEK